MSLITRAHRALYPVLLSHTDMTQCRSYRVKVLNKVIYNVIEKSGLIAADLIVIYTDS